MAGEQIICVFGKPAWMTGLDHHLHWDRRMHLLRKSVRERDFERQTWRQLDQHRAQLVAEPGYLVGELPERLVDIDQAARMRDSFRYLDGKPEVGTNACRPAFIGLAPVRAVEAVFYLCRRQPRGIAGKVRALARETILGATGQGPAGGADPYRNGHVGQKAAGGSAFHPGS